MPDLDDATNSPIFFNDGEIDSFILLEKAICLIIMELINKIHIQYMNNI